MAKKPTNELERQFSISTKGFFIALLVVVVIAALTYITIDPVISTVNNVRFLAFIGLGFFYGVVIFISQWVGESLSRYRLKLRDSSGILNKEAITCELTGLYNRRYFEFKLSEEFRRVLRYRRPLSLILLDIDDFKKVNKSLGQQIGNQILAKTAALITANLRDIDIAVHYENDKFAVIMPETEGQNACIVAERLKRTYLTILKQYRSEDLPLTLSLGVAEFPSSAHTSEDLVAAANTALKESKKNGKNSSNFLNFALRSR